MALLSDSRLGFVTRGLHHLYSIVRSWLVLLVERTSLFLQQFLAEKARPAQRIPRQQRVPIPFIVGQGRSGTTLLRLMLDTHPDLAIPPETWFIPALVRSCLWRVRPREAFLECLTSHPRWENQSIDEQLLRQRIMALKPFTLSEALRSFYRIHAEQNNKSRWGDKTPVYGARLSLIGQLLPEAHFIHIIRDGRAVSASRRTAQFKHSAIEETAWGWAWRIRRARRQAKNLPHYLEVRYEDLILETEPTLRKICAFIDLPWNPVMLDYHLTAQQRMTGDTGPQGACGIHALTRLPPQAGRIDAWKTELSAAERRRFEKIAGKMLRELGYELS
jgi:hypothetical protein